MLKSCFVFFLWINDLYAWDFNLYTLFQRSSTDNYYQSSLSTEKDTYNTISGTIQMSNPRHIIYIQYTGQKYSAVSANDNDYTTLSWTYHRTNTHDYSFSIFSQKYLQTPTNVTDTSSNNKGAKFTSTWTKSFSNKQSGYLSMGYTYTDYYDDTTRKDQLLDLSAGLQTYLGTKVLLTPSFSANYLVSKNNYYQYFSVGPALYLSYFPNDKIVYYISGSYLYTSYAYRTFSLTSISGKVVTSSEKQTLVTTDVGIIYSLTKNVPLQASYSNTKNSSNYSYRDYNTSIFSISIGVNL